MSAKHLEVMIAECTAREYAEIREFLESRGYRLSESSKNDVLRIWCDGRSIAPPAPRSKTEEQALFTKRERVIHNLDEYAARPWMP